MKVIRWLNAMPNMPMGNKVLTSPPNAWSLAFCTAIGTFPLIHYTRRNDNILSKWEKHLKRSYNHSPNCSHAYNTEWTTKNGLSNGSELKDYINQRLYRRHYLGTGMEKCLLEHSMTLRSLPHVNRPSADNYCTGQMQFFTSKTGISLPLLTY